MEVKLDMKVRLAMKVMALVMALVTIDLRAGSEQTEEIISDP